MSPGKGLKEARLPAIIWWIIFISLLSFRIALHIRGIGRIPSPLYRLPLKELFQVYLFPPDRFLEPLITRIILKLGDLHWITPLVDTALVLIAILTARSLFSRLFKGTWYYLFLSTLSIILILDIRGTFDLSMYLSILLCPLIIHKIIELKAQGSKLKAQGSRPKAHYVVLLLILFILPFYGGYKYLSLIFPFVFLIYLYLRNLKNKAYYQLGILWALCLIPPVVYTVVRSMDYIVRAPYVHQIRDDARGIITDADDEDAWMDYAESLLGEGYSGMAGKVANSGPLFRDYRPRVLFIRARTLVLKGMYNKALNLYKELMTLPEYSHEASLNIGRLLLDTAGYEEARSYLGNLVDTEGYGGVARYLLGLCYLNLKELSGAKGIIDSWAETEHAELRAVLKARVLMHEERFEEALRLIDGMGEPITYREYILLARADILSSQGREAAAAVVLERLLSDYPTSYPALERLFRIYIREDRLYRIQEIADRVYRWDMESRRSCEFRGYLHIKRKDVKRALTVFNRCLEFLPDDPWIIKGKGEALLLKGDYEDARDLYLGLLNEGYFVVELLNRLLMASILLEDINGVKRYIKEIHEYEPNDYEPSILGLRFFLEGDKLDEAGEIIVELDAKGLDSPEYKELKGDYYRKGNDLTQAGRYYREAFEEGAREASLHKLIVILEETGEEGELRELLRYGFDLYLTKADLFVRLANVARERGDTQGAIRYLKTALEHDPVNFWARLHLGYLYLDLGDRKGAEEEFDLLISESEGNPHANLAKGLVVYLKGKKQGARPYLEKAYEYMKDNPFLNISLGDVYLSMGKEKRGVGLLEKAAQSPLKGIEIGTKTILFADLLRYYKEGGEVEEYDKLTLRIKRYHPDMIPHLEGLIN